MLSLASKMQQSVFSRLLLAQSNHVKTDFIAFTMPTVEDAPLWIPSLSLMMASCFSRAREAQKVV